MKSDHNGTFYSIADDGRLKLPHGSREDKPCHRRTQISYHIKLISPRRQESGNRLSIDDAVFDGQLGQADVVLDTELFEDTIAIAVDGFRTQGQFF